MCHIAWDMDLLALDLRLLMVCADSIEEGSISSYFEKLEYGMASGAFRF
jgi:hypothetical protein